MRVRMACLWAGLALFGFASFGSAATITEKEAIAQVKAKIKEQLAGFKTNNAGDLADFNTAVDALVDQVENGTVTAVLDMLLELEDATVVCMNSLTLNGMNAFFASGSAGLSLYQNAGIEAPKGFRPGDGGAYDKLRASVEKELLKLRKKIESKLRKAIKSIAKASSGNVSLYAVVRPLRFGNLSVSNGGGSGFAIFNKDQTMSVVLGGGDARILDSGVIVAGGLSSADIFVQIQGQSTVTVVPSGSTWVFQATGLELKNYLVEARSVDDLFHLVDVECIGTAP